MPSWAAGASATRETTCPGSCPQRHVPVRCSGAPAACFFGGTIRDHLAAEGCHAGTFRFKHGLLFIANPLKQHYIGLEEVDDGSWSIYFGRVLLARLDERDYVIRG